MKSVAVDGSSDVVWATWFNGWKSNVDWLVKSNQFRLEFGFIQLRLGVIIIYPTWFIWAQLRMIGTCSRILWRSSEMLYEFSGDDLKRASIGAA